MELMKVLAFSKISVYQQDNQQNDIRSDVQAYLYYQHDSEGKVIANENDIFG